MNSLEQLKRFTTVVVDSGDFEAAQKYLPQDATTNPSLILAAAKLPAYHHLLNDAVAYSKSQGGDAALALDRLIVLFGVEYLKLIPGRVSTEIDARLSYHTQDTVEKARRLIKMYEELGVDKKRILVKIASTWEGIQAARILEAEGIHCNLTLLFSLTQAATCAEAGATLISPFVGRILDWHLRRTGQQSFAPSADPGVQSAKEIYCYLKRFGYHTIVMGASFRNVEEIIELAGIDYLTISPKLMEELTQMDRRIERKLTCDKCEHEHKLTKMSLIDDEGLFRSKLQADEMASELLADGIRRFDQDAQSLQAQLQALF